MPRLMALRRGASLHTHRSAGFQTGCIADFQSASVEMPRCSRVLKPAIQQTRKSALQRGRILVRVSRCTRCAARDEIMLEFPTKVAIDVCMSMQTNPDPK